MYKKNPKTDGSGIICAIPQTGTCPNKCADYFFQSGRSYLEPLDENLPNIPSPLQGRGRVVRINDGNDSNIQRTKVESCAQMYSDVFYNTAINKDLADFPGPVVLTINPGKDTDRAISLFTDPFPDNLIFVRFRANTWNLDLLKQAVSYYTHPEVPRQVPVIVTFMAYFQESLPVKDAIFYTYRQRTLNSYWLLVLLNVKKLWMSIGIIPLYINVAKMVKPSLANVVETVFVNITTQKKG